MNAARIWFVGDPHGDFRRVNRLACERRPAAVIFLGDLELPRPLAEAMYPMLHSKIIVRGIHGNPTPTMKTSGAGSTMARWRRASICTAASKERRRQDCRTRWHLPQRGVWSTWGGGRRLR